MSRPFERDVVISGVGQSAVGRRLQRDPIELTADACLAAIADAGLQVAEIDGLSTYPGSTTVAPGFSGASLREIHDALGIKPRWMTGGIELAGQLGAVVNAMLAVSGGLAHHVLCWRSLWEGTAQGTGGRKAYGGANFRVEGLSSLQLPYGVTAPSLAAMLIRARMERYGLTREQLGIIPVVERGHAALNPAAVYQEPLGLDEYLAARMISTPLCLYDCDVPCDGATAFVVSRREHATSLDHAAVGVESVSCAHLDRFSWEYGTDLTRISSRWCSELWDKTDLHPQDVDVAELYDGFSIFTHCWLEDLGFCTVGDAGQFVGDGTRIGLTGELPLNTHGGQLSAGRLHGFGFLHEACLQLRGEAGQRQVQGAEVAAVGVGAFNSGTTAMLLRRGIE